MINILVIDGKYMVTVFFASGRPGGLPEMKQHVQVNAANYWTYIYIYSTGNSIEK